MTSAPQQPDFADRPPYTRPGFIAAAALLALIVVAGVALALRPSDPKPTPQPGPPPVATGTGAPATSSNVPATAAPVPTTAPANVTWQLVGQVAVPVSATDGPKTVSGGTASGYTHTPVGALIAAAQISTRAGFSAGQQSWEPTLQQQFVPSADRDRLLAALRGAGAVPAQPGELSQIAGFQYQSYTPDTAVIGLAMRAPSAGAARYHILTLTLLWRDGDWRMVAPPGGSWTSVNRQATDLTGVVEWGAR
ncbi:hypothetical protein ACNTMW_30960 [Planosporangium sp. 12N6]|uniref:hypothetical protein n=1 Tax=Planosporangium spinosum TaxID=3402278 RepID=UPI003CFB1906